MIDWSPGFHTPEVFRRRRDEATAQELNRLLASPAFLLWQQEKESARAIRWEVVGGASVVALYTLCTILLLFNGAGGAGRATSQLPALAPPSPPQLYANSTTTSSVWHAPLEIPASLRQEEERLLQQLNLASGELNRRQAELGRVKQELEEALDRTGELSFWLHVAQELAPVAAPAETLTQSKATAAPVVCPGSLPTPMQRLPWVTPSIAAAMPGAEQSSNSSSYLETDARHFSTWADKPAALLWQGMAEEVAASAWSPLAQHAPLLALLGAAVVFAAWMSAQARLNRLRKKEEALQRQLQEAAARLEDGAHAKEEAEQLLEQERCRIVEIQQQQHTPASAALSPASGTSDPSTPFTPATAARYTPGRGELPPPPATLVEKFLKDRHAVAVEEAQVQEWLAMEEELDRVRDELAALAQQRATMQTQHQLLTTQANQRSRDEQVQYLKEWLGVAQEELLNTQSQLQESETECRRLTAALEAARRAASNSGSSDNLEAQARGVDVAAAERSLLQQNRELVAELQKVTAAFETLQAQFSSTQMQLASKEAESRRVTAELGSGLQDGAAQTSPVAPAALSSSQVELVGEAEVGSMLDLMRATRLSLASRLGRSREVCMTTLNGLAKLAGQGQEELGPGADHSCRSANILNSPPPSAPPRQSSPGPAENTPLNSSSCQNASPVPTNFSFTALPAKRGVTPCSAAGGENAPSLLGRNEGSLRKTRQAARQQVASIRGQYSSFELGAFLHRLGCLASAPGAAASTREEWDALKEQGMAALKRKASQGKTAFERAVAGEGLRVLEEWQWPVQPVKAPPQSPAWYERLVGLE